jgi:hypothetical protein
MCHCRPTKQSPASSGVGASERMVGTCDRGHSRSSQALGSWSGAEALWSPSSSLLSDLAMEAPIMDSWS